jgi:CheY-like chemotaxis protein
MNLVEQEPKPADQSMLNPTLSVRGGGGVLAAGAWVHQNENDPKLSLLAFSLLSSIGEGVGLATREGKLIWANDMLANLSHSLRERLGNACRQFEVEHPAPPEMKYPAGWLPPRTELALAEGEKFYEVALTPVSPQTISALDAETYQRCLVVLVRDDSAARKLQQRINAIDQAGSELMRFDADQVRKLNAVERLKYLEQKIVRFAHDLLHFDHFAVRLLDRKTGRLELVMGYGLPQEYDNFTIKPALEGHGITGYVAASGRSYVCPNTQSDPLYLPGVIDAKSSLTVPMRIHDEIIGVMNIESRELNAFGEQDRQLGEIFARYIAVAIHMLDMLVVERTTTNQSVSGRVEREINEPLEDIAHEIEILEHESRGDAEAQTHLSRIKRDLSSIRSRLAQCAAGPAGLLGVEEALAHTQTDPLIAGKRVLVADDELRIRSIISTVLEKRGGTVTVVESGTEALEAVANAPIPFDLVLSDIRMPGANGYEVFAAARRANASARVILMTGFGYDPHHSIVRASQEGLQSVLFKPFQVERMIDEVRKALTPA